MARRKKKAEQGDVFDVITGFAQAVDTIFERLTGKPIAAWMEEFQQRPREQPAGESVATSESDMSLESAYAVLGLPPTASIEEVERNYRNLAKVFHPDKGGYTEAMRFLNQAYEMVKRKKRNR